MFVIMDMEWIETRQKAIYPTQIAAMRVDDNWDVIDQYSDLIRPGNNAGASWDHIAFTGYRPYDFMAGHSEEQAFACLSQWLRPDDVLLWWADIPQATFQAIADRYPNLSFPQETKCLHAAVDAVFRMKGDVYKLARAHGISVPYQPHVSINDVKAISALLHGVAMNPDYIDSPPPKRFELSKKLASKFPYWYDRAGKLVHFAGGECMTADMQLEHHPSVKSCIKDKLKPCPVCCKERFRRDAMVLTTELIKKSNYNFIFSPASMVFHTAECPYARRIPYSALQGTGKFKTCLAAGKRPCKHCNPTVDYRFHRSEKPFEIQRSEDLIEEQMDADILGTLCQERNYGYKHCNDIYYITTPVSKWRIEVHTHTLQLWHVNLLRCRSGADHYHRQPVTVTTLRSAFRYIQEHDGWLLHREGPNGRKAPYDFGQQVVQSN